MRLPWFPCRIKILPNLLVQLLLIPLHTQYVIPSPFLDLFRNRPLAPLGGDMYPCEPIDLLVDM